MAEIINLRRVRKRLMAAKDERSAAENRARFGQSGAEKRTVAMRTGQEESKLDGARLQPGAANRANDDATTT